MISVAFRGKSWLSGDKYICEFLKRFELGQSGYRSGTPVVDGQRSFLWQKFSFLSARISLGDCFFFSLVEV